MKRILGYSFLVFLDFVLLGITGKTIYIVLGLALIVWGIKNIYDATKLRMKFYLLILILCNIVFAIARTNHNLNFIENIEQDIRRKPNLEITGTVLNIEEREKNDRVLIRVKSSNHFNSVFRKTKGYIYIKSAGNRGTTGKYEKNIEIEQRRNFCVGDSVVFSGEVSCLEPAMNDGGYSERDNLYGQGIYFKMFNPLVCRKNSGGFSFGRMMYSLRQKMNDEFSRNLPREEGSLVSQMCIGNKSDGDEIVKELFRLAGIISLLSISGTHVLVVSRSLYGLLRKRRYSFKMSMIVSVAVALLYGNLCGNSISAVRAIACFMLMTLAQYLGMSYDSVSALAFIAYAMVIRNPYIVMNSSFQLSFGIMFGVIYIAYPAAVRIKTAKRRVWNLKHKNSGVDTYRLNTKDRICIYVLMIFLIQLWSIPIISFLFYEMPTYSCIANVILMPLFPVLLICALFGSFLSMIGEMIVSSVLFMICHAIIYGFEMFSDMLTRLPFYHVITGKPSDIWIFSYYAILIIIFSDYFRFSGRVHKLSVCVLIGMLLISPRRGKSVNMLYVGQGDGIHISMGRGVDFFLDGGNTSESGEDLGKFTLDPYFKSHRITDIDEWFVTHTDEDHISGLIYELERGFSIGEIVTSKQIYETENFREIETLAAKNHTKIRLVKAGDKLEMSDSASIEVISPDEGMASDDVNDYSLTFVLCDGEGFSGLFTGDLSAEMEEKLLDRFSEVNLLKACHHGSNLSNSEPFLRRVSPDIIIISAGKRNRYGHPGKRALSRMDKLHYMHVCTIDHGQISIGFDDGRMWWKR